MDKLSQEIGGASQEIAGLRQEIEKLITETAGSHSIYLKDLKTGKELAIAADQEMAAASLIKIPILYTLYDLEAKGKLDLNTTLKPDDSSIVGGAGVLNWFKARPELTILDLAELMIVISDNTATNILIDYLGFKAVNQYLEAKGFKVTRLKRKMMDFEARKAGSENISTAREIGRLMEFIYKQQGLRRAKATLCRQQFRDKLSYLLPDNSWDSIASKTGMLTGIEHDASLFFKPWPAVAVTMSKELDSQAEGRLLQAKIGKKIYQYLEKKGG
ncbi:MAG: serine hydrolase [Halarsenatibacteraceae bacterium]